MIYIGADHGGFELKGKVIEYLRNKGVEVEDVGAFEFNPHDDYPDFASAVAVKVSNNLDSKGVLFCRNGVGVSVTANKFRDVRAVRTSTPEIVRTSRNDDDVNVLCIASDYIDDNDALDLVDVFLDTPFGPEPRFFRRLQKVNDIEDSWCKSQNG